MNTVMQLILALMLLFFIWRLYRFLKLNPALLNRQNMAKSFSTMGMLALILIGGIGMLVVLLKW